MKTVLRQSPREFKVGDVTIRDCGSVHPEPNEMLTVTTPSGRNCDVTVMEWGIYLGSSVNVRMKAEGFRVALVENGSGKRFLNAVETDKLALFEAYLREQGSRVLAWLDNESEKRQEYGK